MNATERWRAARPQRLSHRYRNTASAGFALAAIVCGPVTGQDGPEDIGQWNDPPNTDTLWGVDHGAFAQHAVHLPDGTILIWHEIDDESFLWEPLADTLTEVTISDGPNISCSGHAGLPDGKILVAGGQTIEEAMVFSLQSCSECPWASVADMADARFYPTCTTLPDGRVLVSSGNVVTSEIFDPGANPFEGTWEDLGFDTDDIGQRYPHMFVIPDGDPDVHKVFFSSSFLPADQEDDEITYVLDIGAETWTAVGGLPPFTTKFGSAVMYEPGKVLKCGGDLVGGGGITKKTATINLNDSTPTWQSETDMGIERSRHTLVLLPNGKILAVGGEHSGPVKVAEWFDPATG